MTAVYRVQYVRVRRVVPTHGQCTSHAWTMYEPCLNAVRAIIAQAVDKCMSSYDLWLQQLRNMHGPCVALEHTFCGACGEPVVHQLCLNPAIAV